ncbi:hypothetical protein I79_019456 [Cricetulus griseus]|uniref:Uncharacterized protein n=1 Tax=Cricetulus griseus TaxID=10029 RepID=G3I7G7_CRIGR|nr:hypothetical protein I79_019456 [Cricetulus griseus]
MPTFDLYQAMLSFMAVWNRFPEEKHPSQGEVLCSSLVQRIHGALVLEGVS